MAAVLACGAFLRLCVQAVGLSLADRLLGGLFGLIKVVLITSILLIIASKSVPEIQTQLMAESVLAPYLWRSAEYLAAFLEQHDDVVQWLYQQFR
jgi:uncharacterized membrane protein required for colicin V production